MTKEEERIEVLKKKAAFYHSKDIPVHVTLHNGQWLNGKITESNSPDFFLMEDNEEGELPVFYIEAYDIRKFKQNNKEDKNESAGNRGTEPTARSAGSGSSASSTPEDKCGTGRDRKMPVLRNKL